MFILIARKSQFEPVIGPGMPRGSGGSFKRTTIPMRAPASYDPQHDCVLRNLKNINALSWHRPRVGSYLPATRVCQEASGRSWLLAGGEAERVTSGQPGGLRHSNQKETSGTACSKLFGCRSLCETDATELAFLILPCFV